MADQNEFTPRKSPMNYSNASTAASLLSLLSLLAGPVFASDPAYAPLKAPEPELYAYCAAMGGYPSFEAQAAAARRNQRSQGSGSGQQGSGLTTGRLSDTDEFFSSSSMGSTNTVATWRSSGAAVSKQSTQVAADQRSLKALGHYKGDIDGRADAATEVAIMRFRRANGLGDGTTLDARSRQILEVQAISAKYAAPGSVTRISTASSSAASHPVSASNKATAARSGGTVVSGGSTGSSGSPDEPDRLRDDQQALAELGFYKGEVDGRTGPGTRAAIRSFKEKHGLKADATLDRETRTMLHAERSKVTAR